MPYNGRVEWMNRTLKDATVGRCYYASHNQPRQHLADFLRAYTFTRKLKTFKILTPNEFIWKIWPRRVDILLRTMKPAAR
jgi:hypothetical protein